MLVRLISIRGKGNCNIWAIKVHVRAAVKGSEF